MHLDRCDSIYGVFYASSQSVSKMPVGVETVGKKQNEISKKISPKLYEEAIHNSVSKANLITFLFESWTRCSDILPEHVRFLMSGGFSNRLAMHAMTANGLTRPSDTEEYLLCISHEEADTRVFLHTFSAVQNCCKRIIIRASDTDIVVISLYLFEQLATEGLEELFIKSKDYYIPVHEVEKVFSDYEKAMLPLLHALSGCDTTSFLYIKGKRAFINAITAMNVAPDLASVCKELEATIVFTSMYCGETFANLDALRYYLYARRKALEALPPTDDALRQHVLRSLYQTRTWVQAAQPVPAILEPFNFGWKNDVSGTAPLMTTKTNTPDHLRTASLCKCKKGVYKKVSLQKEMV